MSGLPGFAGLDLPAEDEGSEPYIFHFPDGNASIARLMVRAMIPAVAPGNSMEDIVTAEFEYGRLDEPGAPARVRLNSTVVDVRHLGEPGAADETEITYVHDGKAHRVRARGCVLACYNSAIPYMCPEMPEGQKRALSNAAKAPLVYTNVLLRNWTSFERLGIQSVYCPGSYHTRVGLDFPVSLGDYRFPSTPAEPMVLQMTRAPLSLGLSAAEQFKAGRYDLLSTSFEEFERRIRDQLGRVLSEGGFDPARDIEAITVNRWPHGYAYGYDPESGEIALSYDPEKYLDWPAERRSWLAARQPFGRITIANSDAASDAYTDAAIAQGHRAVTELIDIL